MQFIGIDLGTTSIKGAVLDLDARRLGAITRRPFPAQVSGQPRWHYEVDQHEVVQATRLVLDELLAHTPQAEGVLLCSQMHGVVLLNEALQPISNVITWQDQRALSNADGPPSLDSLRAILTPEDVRVLGNDVWASRPIAMLHWLRQHRYLPQNALFCSLPDYVFTALSGEQPVTDAGHAAASAMFDVIRSVWHYDLLGRLGLGDLRLPKVVPHNQAIGQSVHRGRVLRWYPPVADQQCSLLGARLMPGELSINISTGSQVGMLSNTPNTGPFQTRPYFDGMFLLTNIHIPAGRSLNALMRLLTELAEAEGVQLQHIWTNVERLAQAADPTDLKVDLSFFAGALGNEGAITHVREDNLSVGHLFRAAFTGMAQNYETCALHLSPERAWTRVVFSGGLALQSSLLRDTILARFGGGSRLAEGGEDALVGLLAVALYAAGHAASVGDARLLIDA